MIYEFYIKVSREDGDEIRVNVQREIDGSYIVDCNGLTTGELRQVLETVDAVADLNWEE